MMIQKLGGLLLIVILVVAFLPNVNAAPIVIDDDSDTDSSGTPNSEIGFFEADDDATWLYFYISTPVPLSVWEGSIIVYIVDFYDPNANTYWRAWGEAFWFGAFALLSSGLDASEDGVTYFTFFSTPGTFYDIAQFDIDTICLNISKNVLGIPPTMSGYTLTNIFATTDATYPGSVPTPSAPPAHDRSPSSGGGTYGTQIPEFSTLLIPIIGTIALFAVFRKYKKK